MQDSSRSDKVQYVGNVSRMCLTKVVAAVSSPLELASICSTQTRTTRCFGQKAATEMLEHRQRSFVIDPPSVGDVASLPEDGESEQDTYNLYLRYAANASALDGKSRLDMADSPPMQRIKSDTPNSITKLEVSSPTSTAMSLDNNNVVVKNGAIVMNGRPQSSDLLPSMDSIGLTYETDPMMRRTPTTLSEAAA
ncbi:hypothetical protein U1Q18_047171 [Sarracenia purpurea var. burkii]